MKQHHLWLLALLSILILMTTTVAFAGETMTSGRVEIGISGINTSDSPARVNEYSTIAPDDGLYFTPKVSLDSVNDDSAFEFDANIMGLRDYQMNLEVDAQRILKLEVDLQKFQHWKDHDNLEHLGATMQGDLGGDQPRVFTNATKDPDQYAWELEQDYLITRSESKADTSLTLPIFPNITFHAGIRIEERKGLEQAIAMSKCSACHIEANPKEIDERTEEFRLGATGKFGLLTLEYEYLTRDFDDQSNNPTYNYYKSGKVRFGSSDVNNMLYINDELDYNMTPDSKKESHLIKARVDLKNNTVITGTYVKADIESQKEEQENVYSFVGSDNLTSKLESFAIKGATRINALRLSMYGSTYEIDGADYTVSFDKRVDNVDWDNDGTMDAANNTFEQEEHYESAESRDVVDLGLDAVYRISRGTTLRLGYNYEEIKRAHADLGETETSTYKLAINSRLGKGLNARFSYSYQDIEDPFHGENATGIAQGHIDAIVEGDLAYLMTADYIQPGPDWDGNTDDLAEGNTAAVYYWNSVYPARGLDATDQPEAVHEAKLSSTWSPAANMALTGYFRVRFEENDDVKYQETTYVPGFNFWYAPTNKLNLVMAYNFNKQETENQMCVGWYHG